MAKRGYRMNERDDGALILPERFDFDYHTHFNAECERLLASENTRRIVLDFARVRYIDSAALGLLVLLHRKTSPKGIELVARNAAGNAKDILDIANIQRFYRME